MPALLTCVTCRVIFGEAEQQRVHYQSDWHRYNLKRKVAELEPITNELFQKKLLASQDEQVVVAKSKFVCVPCGRTFKSEETFKNHFVSKKHKEMEKRRAEATPKKKLVNIQNEVLEVNIDDDVDDEWEDVEEAEESSENVESMCRCLFCSRPPAVDLEDNLRHMSLEHGFFIPDFEYCVDPEGLIIYLTKKVQRGRFCLWCGRQKHRSGAALQQHMRDKGHCKMFHEEDAVLEYADFFDFSSSYPEEAVEESEPSEPVPAEVLEERNWELVLPSGATVGHRSLRRFYKQHLKPLETTPVGERRKLQSSAKYANVVAEYRSLGWTGTTGEMAKRKAKDLKFAEKFYAYKRLKVASKANKLFSDRGRTGC